MKTSVPITALQAKQNDIANFDQIANNPESWKIQAEDLYLAAAVLRDKATSMSSKPKSKMPKPVEAHRYSGVILPSIMLQGFAIELFLKTYWITKGNTVSVNGKYSIPTIKRDAHNLPSIANGVGFKLSAKEREVLTRLSLFVSSYGRYPITKNRDQNPMTKNKQGVPHRLNWNNVDHKTAEAVIKRLKGEIETLPKSRAKANP